MLSKKSESRFSDEGILQDIGFIQLLHESDGFSFIKVGSKKGIWKYSPLINNNKILI